jgi:hypothetical protein
MKKVLLFSLAVLSCLGIVAYAAGGMPKGWFMAGTKPSAYAAEIDPANAHDGHPALHMHSLSDAKVEGFGTVMQKISADKYLGKRVRFSGYMKSDKVTSWAGFWMRVDNDKGQSPEFDNMQSRAIKGTTDWKKYDIVLDVPRKDSVYIAFGFLMDETGDIWVSGMKMEVVDKSVPVTAGGEQMPDHPVNLDFDSK